MAAHGPLSPQEAYNPSLMTGKPFVGRKGVSSAMGSIRSSTRAGTSLMSPTNATQYLGGTQSLPMTPN